ncbi:DUF5686 and carboxypeptidase regulatory-like domain-containing protein [Neolewinella antarctica]|uniref:TonB-dependent receptor n=1 Tax=Neolewinella antarctica TaxID=442734 RepID=A0ABX0XH44_9BACT|nr:DUF5686 and carboxypeptidase regulatory-like domain-containing protein [Neolewinella antarctica]NJC28169.1 hypothetical protein [Neolewinella antarctica]
MIKSSLRLALFPLVLLLSVFAGTGVRAQNVLTGVITDQETGEPLPFASIYVQETQTGSASNANGEYYVRLGGGVNTVIFQYLGYETLVKRVSSGQRFDVKLNSQALELGTVEIVSGGEDISYSVIRRAIAKADYHLNQVEKYTADVYIKGTGKVNKVGGVINMLAGKEGREEIAESVGRPFTSESTSTVFYERPNKYRQEVKQAYTVGDEQFDASNYIFTTFYQPLIAEQVVSPLHSKAFGYYKFEQLGTFIDQDELVNKIRVTPRSRGEDVFEGTINIVQGDWSIHSLDLTTYKLGFKIDIRQNYAEVEEHTWMPITTTLDVGGSLLGIDFEYHYLSTIGNYDLELNPALTGYVEVIDEKSQPEVAARTAKKSSIADLEEALGNGEAIKRKDLRRLMKTYAKQEREESDEPEVVSDYTFIDSTAVTVSDSAAWAGIRPVPLTAEEIKGYAMADSARVVNSMEQEGGPVDTTKIKRNTTPGKMRSFRRQSADLLPIFNPVQGYVLGGKVTWGNQNKAFGFGVQPSYGFAAKRGYLELDAYFGKSGYRDDQGDAETPRFRLAGGQGLRQFNPSPSIDPWLSAFYNLMTGDNYIRLYEREYLQFEYNRAYSNELGVTAKLSYENRRGVTNNSDQNWFGLDDEEVYAANQPVNNELGRVFGVTDAATIDVGVTWQPGLKYKLVNGNREMIEDSAPTLGLNVRQGVPNLGSTRSDFTELQASYEHRFDVGRKGKVQFLARAGAFLNDGFVDFADFRHFEGSEITFVAADPLRSYRLLPYYAESTSQEYAEVYAHYQFRKFLLTQITKLNLFGLREDLFVNYLYTLTSDNYTELGYSLDKILRVFRVEFVTSWRDGRYEDFGVRVGVATSISDL